MSVNGDWSMEKSMQKLRFPEFLHWWGLQVSWEVASLWFWAQAAPLAAGPILAALELSKGGSTGSCEAGIGTKSPKSE